MDNVKIGAFIATVRKQQGLTQAALAEKLNISNRTVSKWENADGMPDISLLPLLAQELGVSVDELLAGERKQPTAEIKVTELANGDNMKNLFEILAAVSFFCALVGALLGCFTNLYGIWAFNVLFFNHWEIIFDAVSFFALILSAPLFTVGVIRLRLSFSKQQVRQMAFQKGAVIGLMAAAFLCAFSARLIDHALSVSGALAHIISGANTFHANICAYIAFAVLFSVCIAVFICVLKEEKRQEGKK